MRALISTVGIIALSGALAFCVFGLIVETGGEVESNMPTTSAKVANQEKRYLPSSGGVPSYDVTVKYTVRDKEYSCKDLNRPDASEKVGSKVTVEYDSTDPSNCHIKAPVVTYAPYFIAGIVVCVIGLIGIVFGLVRSLRRANRPVEY